MTQTIPIEWKDEPSAPVMAMKPGVAAKSLGIGPTKMWQLLATGKIRKTSYGTIPVTELERHLKAEVEP